MDIFRRLKNPFEADRVSWRVGSTNGDKTKGLALAYIDARDVMERLDEVVGPDCWQDRYEVHGTKTICYLSLNIPDVHGGDRWITKADAAGDTDVEAEKGAVSDAFKRAAVKWGIGRYLYDLESIWVSLEPAGKSYRIAKDEKKRLVDILNANANQSDERRKKEDREAKLSSARDWALNQILSLQTLSQEFRQAWLNEPQNRERLVSIQKTMPDVAKEFKALDMEIGE
jgi:hypothetical protein